MASLRARTSQAAVLHRQAAAAVAAAAAALDATRPAPADQREQHDLAERLRAAAAVLVPGWLGAPLDALSADAPLGGPGLPGFVRIGTAQPLDDARFPAVVPLLGTGHLTVDADARDPRVAGLLRAVLLRLLAAAPAGSLLVRAVDGAAPGQVFAPFGPLSAAGLMPPPVTDRTGLRAVLTEAEQWVRPARSAVARQHRRDRTLLLVIASLPELTEGDELSRIGALAQHGPGAGLHLIVAGWPPPPLTAETTQPPLTRTTMIAMRNPYALVSDPPGATFSHPMPYLPSTGLNAPIFVDEDPPAHLVDRVCRELSAQVDTGASPTLGDLLPDATAGLWHEDAAEGLVTTVGHAGNRAVTLHFNDLTPHWMVSGRAGAGKSSFLVNVLYGLCTRYAPTQLALYLVDFTDGEAYAEFVPTQRDRSWLPHVRAAGINADREYGLAVLRALDAELTRRAADCQLAGVSRFADLPPEHRRPRVICVLDGFPMLFGGGDQLLGDNGRLPRGGDRLAAEAMARLDSLARTGRSYGIHLILTSQAALPANALHATRDSVFGQFPVRVALPGGGDVLEPANDAAVSLPLGTAVVNTAGGLGGPRGATRGHERVVRFPDPHADHAVDPVADPVADHAADHVDHAVDDVDHAGLDRLDSLGRLDRLDRLRHQLWEQRDPAAAPPPVFVGHQHQHLADDPTYRAALADHQPRPAALLGRTIDVPLSTAVVPLDPSPGRHLAILGPSATGAALLDAAVRSVAAHHHPNTTRFVIASLITEADPVARGLAADLARWQEVETVDATGLAKALATEQPGYLVVFGMDAVGPELLPADLLHTMLRQGPDRGTHLLSWWRRLRRFSDEFGGELTRKEIATMAFLDVPGTQVSRILGQPVEWQPRPNRVLLYDGQTGGTTLVVPFVRPGDAA